MTKEEIGKRIRGVRNIRGLSQEELALECGLDRTYINSIENGKRNLTIDSLSRITDVLNISLKDFFDSDYIIRENKDDTVILISCDTMNYESTMIKGVPYKDLEGIFSEYEYKAMGDLQDDDGLLYIWGTTDANITKFELILEGNIGVFSRDRQIISHSRVLMTLRNKEFSQKYWKDSRGKEITWPNIMIMEKPVAVSIDAAKMLEYAGYKKKFVQGFMIPRGEHNYKIAEYLKKQNS